MLGICVVVDGRVVVCMLLCMHFFAIVGSVVLGAWGRLPGCRESAQCILSSCY